jgi:hypothetical protein
MQGRTTGFNRCSESYKIPKPTLKRQLDGKVLSGISGNRLNGRLPTLPPEVENEIVAHIIKLESRFFDMTITDRRKLACEVTEKNGFKHLFNKALKMAGKKWYYNLMKRHPNLPLRQPESTSMTRVKGFCKKNVNHFVDILETICDENQLDATRIYNVDESGFSTVRKKC